jgi:hypothetical protein
MNERLKVCFAANAVLELANPDVGFRTINRYWNHGKLA